jgi:hypothetical protein
MIYDVVIAGAGPVGLFLAGELRLADLSVLVLEQAEDPRSPLKRLPFGMRGLWAPTLEAFYRRGLLIDIAMPQLSQNDSGSSSASSAGPGAKLPRRPAGHFAGILFDSDKIDPSKWPYRLPTPAVTHMATDMEHIESGLAAHASAMGVEIRGVSLRYDFGGSHPLVGRSAPDFELVDGTKLGELLRAGRGLFLDFDARATLQSLASRWRNRITYVASDAKDRLGLSAVLVRPDGFVAWVAEAAPDFEGAAQAVSRWFGQPEEMA